VPPAYPEVDRVLLHPSATRSVIGDATSTTLHAALSGLAQRQRVTADNIANIQTPGFLAGRVDFESSLRGALRNGEAPSVNGGRTARSLEPTNTNGNNVNLDQETVIATETGLRYQLALNALDGKYNVLRSSLRTQ
jgi:flagellar basal-body rod protein FlgB